MRLPSLSYFHVSRRNGVRRTHVFDGGGDIMIGVALIAALVLLTHMVSMATDAVVRLFGG